MEDPFDRELQKTPPIGARSRRRSPATWIAAVLLVVAVGAAAYVYFRQGAPPAAPPAAGPPAADSAAPPPEPLGGEPEPIEVPPLDASDEVVRQLVAKLSQHPRVAAWLTTDGLIRNFTVVVENIASGQSPARHLGTLRPEESFVASESGEQLLIDPRSYDRYRGIAEAVGSIDPVGAARLYATLKPRIEEAYRELGHDEPFDRALERAIVALLSVPVVEEPIEVAPQGVVYEFADPRLARLTAAQKQLLRMGPANVRTIQSRLREIALALGIPPERLPR